MNVVALVYLGVNSRMILLFGVVYHSYKFLNATIQISCIASLIYLKIKLLATRGWNVALLSHQLENIYLAVPIHTKTRH